AEMRWTAVGLWLGAALFATSAAAYDADDPKNCNGVDWDDKRRLVVSKVTSTPRGNFIKSPNAHAFRALPCPAHTDACPRKAYLVTGDVVLTGKTRETFTCVTYQSPQAKKQFWTTGWLPSTALAPIAPMSPVKTSDWTGEWTQPGGTLNIST